MGNTLDTLEDIRGQIAAHTGPLNEARARRDAVLKIAGQFPGVNRTYKSGSLAAGLMNHPVTDGDCGVVLDRRSYPELGPDGGNVGPTDIVDKVHAFVTPLIKGVYPDARVSPMKRGLLIEVNEPMADEGQDPTVDLVVALNRRDDDALWIPRIDRKTDVNIWQPGHPEKHLALLRAGSKPLVAVRARVIRIGKAWKCQADPSGICSFNIAALALGAITYPMPFDEAMATFFEYAARDLNWRLTPDPAHVSGAITIEMPPGRDVVVRRLSAAASGLRRAMENDNDPDAVAAELSAVFPDYVKPPTGSKSAIADALRNGNKGLGYGAAAGISAAGTAFKSTRAFGGPRELEE